MKRIMPNSLEAEQSVVGSMLMDKDAILVASETLRGEDFYIPQCGILFDTMVELYQDGKPAELVTILTKLEEKGISPEICGMEFIREVTDAAKGICTM